MFMEPQLVSEWFQAWNVQVIKKKPISENFVLYNESYFQNAEQPTGRYNDSRIVCAAIDTTIGELHPNMRSFLNWRVFSRLA